MKKIFLLFIVALMATQLDAQPTRTIFITGGDFGTPFLTYVMKLTGKSHPKICFVPTASADNPYGINYFYSLCAEQPVSPFILRTFLNSSPEQKTFEEVLLDMDAIIVGGGSTLNMMAVWKAQGIDTILRKAYEKGIVLAGGSAGSLCWFTGGFTDSRPQKLSLVECLGFLQYSHCPHYHSEPSRKPLYEEAILHGKLLPGYACDDHAGILFQNEKYIKSVASDSNSHTYFLSVVDGKIKEEQLTGGIIP